MSASAFSLLKRIMILLGIGLLAVGCGQKPSALTATPFTPYFVAGKAVLNPQECTLVSWQMPDTRIVTIDIYQDSAVEDVIQKDVPYEPIGSFEVCSDDPAAVGKMFTYDLRSGSRRYTVQIYLAQVDSYYTPQPLETILIFGSGGLMGGAYQTFEHGFMLYFIDVGCVLSFAYESDTGVIFPENAYRYSDYDYCVTTNSFPPAPPTSGLSFELQDDIYRVWHYNPNIQAVLGMPTQPNIFITAYVPPQESPIMGSPYGVPVITLPDGQELYCGSRAATAGTCQLR